MASDIRTLNGELVSDRGSFAVLTGAVWATLRTWVERAEARRDLAELTPREVADIGFDADELEREIAKPFWRA